MNKKIAIIVGIVVLALLGVGGGFLWQENQKAVAEVNKNLPEGIRVTKSLFGNEYRVTNKTDGYEFMVPSNWDGLSEIEYKPERNVQGFSVSSLGFDGKEGGSIIASVDRYKINDSNINLENWAKTNFETFGLVGNFTKENVAGIEVLKTQENVHLAGMSVYFFQKGSAIYAITNGSEDYIKEILNSGKW